MEENPRKSFSPIRDAPSCVMLAGEEAKDKLYEPKNKKKLVRVLTVIAYMFSVSLAAIMLSLYYMFLWSPRNETTASAQVVYPPCQIPDPIVMERLSKQMKQQQVPIVMPAAADARPTPAQVEKQSTRKANNSNHRKHQKNQPPDVDDLENAKRETEYSESKQNQPLSND